MAFRFTQVGGRQKKKKNNLARDFPTFMWKLGHVISTSLQK